MASYRRPRASLVHVSMELFSLQKPKETPEGATCSCSDLLLHPGMKEGQGAKPSLPQY